MLIVNFLLIIFLYKKWGIFIYILLYFYIKVVDESIDLLRFFIFVGENFLLMFYIMFIDVLYYVITQCDFVTIL